MTDTSQIRDLYTRYTYNGDRGRLADLAACFAEDGTLEFPGGKGTGFEAPRLEIEIRAAGFDESVGARRA